jgi:hypothetical protein
MQRRKRLLLKLLPTLHRLVRRLWGQQKRSPKQQRKRR